MNVLFINMAWDAAGCSILQAKAINKHTDWKARHFRAVPTFGYETDITPENYCRDGFRVLVEEADVIEWCSADHKYPSPHDFRFDLWEIAKKKKNIFHDYNSFLGHWKERADAKDVWTRKDDLGYAAIFSSIPQAVNIYKDCVYIPDVVDELSPEYTPDPERDFSKVILGHYPTGGGNNKNTVELQKALQICPVQTDIAYPPIQHADLLRRKRKINLAFDALWRGFHGMTTVENMALGIPTMCRIDEGFYPIFKEFFGPYSHPFIPVDNVEDVVRVLETFKNEPEELMESAKMARLYMEGKWSFKNIATRIVREYEKL